MAAPVIASSTVTVGSDALAVPSGVVSGSKVIAHVFGGWFSTTAPTSAAFTAPAGWTFAFGQAYHDTPDAAYAWEAWYWKDATASDTGTYTFTANKVGGNSQFQVYGGFVDRITGMPAGNPFVDTLQSSGTAMTDTAPWVVPTFTPGGDGTLLIGGQFCFSAGSSGTMTGPTGWTTVSNTNTNGMGQFSLAQTTAAATGSLSFGGVGATDYGFASVVALRAPASAVTGSAAVTLPKPVVAASGVDTSYNTGSAAATLGRPSISASATQKQTGSASVTLPNPTARATNITPLSVITTALNSAAAGTSQARVLFLGDSVLEGEGASSRANRGSAKLITELRSRKSISGGGSGMILHYQATSLPETASWSNPLTASSGIASNAWFSTQGRRGADYNAASDYAEWTVQGTSVDFVSLHGTGDGGSFSVSVDGGAATVIDSSSGSLTCSVATRISLGASGSHTVKATLTAGAGAADGLVVYDGDETTGITWWDCTHGGYSSQDFANTGFADYRNAWTAFDPHLIVDNSTGIGDYNGSDTLSQFTTNLTARLDVYAALPSKPDVILLLTYKLGFQQTNTNSVGLTVQNYYDQAASIAASYPNVTVLDLNAVYPNFASTSGWLASDNGHPSDLGHQAIADAVANAILGPPSVSGTAAATLGKPSASASATITITGTSAVTVAGPQASASAVQTDTGSAAATVQAPSVSASGQLLLSGTATATFPAPTASASATQSDSGSAGVSLPPFTVSAQDVPIISGTVDVTLGTPAASAAGTQTVTGTVTIHPASAAVSADGQVTVTGAAHVTIPVPDVNATGIQTGPVLGTAQVVLPQALVAAIGAQTVTGSVAVHLPVPGVFTSSFAAQPWPNLWSVSVLGGFITMSADAPISLTAIT